MVFGFAAAFAGDWMLAVRCSPTGSTGFLAGVGFFALAHVLWTIGQLKGAPLPHPARQMCREFGRTIVKHYISCNRAARGYDAFRFGIITRICK